jgi:hypothetical protein
MATTNVMDIASGVIGGQGFKQLHLPCANATASVHVGDLVYLSGIVKPLDTDGNAASGVGLALQPSIVNSNLDNGSIPVPTDLLVGWDLVANLKTTASEVYAHGMKVYIGADAQTITSVAGSNHVGRIELNPGQTTLTGAAGLRVGVVIVSKLY